MSEIARLSTAAAKAEKELADALSALEASDGFNQMLSERIARLVLRNTHSKVSQISESLSSLYSGQPPGWVNPYMYTHMYMYIYIYIYIFYIYIYIYVYIYIYI